MDNGSSLLVGEEHTHHEYLWVKKEYGSKYKILRGGFDDNGNVIPNLGKFNVVSCINVIEYLNDPKKHIEGLFAQATDRVIIATDIDPYGVSREITTQPPMKWLCGLDDMKKWLPWPSVHWILDTKDSTPSRYQLFIVATNPDSQLAPVTSEEVVFDTEVTATERFYRKTGCSAAW